MAMRDLWSRVAGGRQSQATVSTQETLSDVLTRYDLVEVVPNDGDPFVIVAERGPVQGTEVAPGVTMREALDPQVLLTELGSSAPSPFTSFVRQEYNRELAGINGLRKYDQMRRGDGTVRGTLRLVKTPVLAARWFVEPASNSVRDKNAARFVEDCLTNQMSISFSQVLTEALLMADFGYYMFEKVWDERIIDGKARLVWKKLAPRHPMDVKSWDYDAHGGPQAVRMYPSTMNTLANDIIIPIEKLLVFTFDREAGNIEGLSVLRSAYKHWYYKDQLYKIDAIQKERHGIGVPVIKLPPGFSKDDKTAAENLGRNLRTNERAHVVLPPNWELTFAKLEGQPVKALESIEHHDARIRENVLSTFSGDKVTTKEEDQTIFLKATRFVADIVCDTFNQYGIPELIEHNFSRVGVPKLRARRIGETEDQRTLSFTVRNLVGAKVLTPDKPLEEYVRRELDLPPMDEESARVEEVDNATKQNGQQVGMPRQAPAPPVGTPAKNAGTDRSGGK